MKLIGGQRIFTYTAVGIIPSQVPAHMVEAWVRAGVSWNDLMLSTMRNITVLETEINAAELSRLQGGRIQPS